MEKKKVTANEIMHLKGFDWNTKWGLMLEIIKDTAKVQVDQTGNSGAISMTVGCLPSYSFPAGVGRADFQRGHSNTFNE